MTAQHSQTVRKVIVVLGAPGDGGPLVSNLLQSLGVDMADLTASGGSDDESPSERPALLEIYDELSAMIDHPASSLAHVLPLPAAWWRQKEVQSLKLGLTAYVRGELERSDNLWGFEDPRTGRFLPLWWEVFRELELEPVYIHAIRRPGPLAEGARSAWSASSELLWLAYNYDIARHATAKDSETVLVVDHERWFEDGSGIARELAAELETDGSLFEDGYGELVRELLRDEPQYEGAPGAPKLTQAAMLYSCLVEGRWRPGGDRHELRPLLQEIDALFASMRSILLELDARMGILEDENRRAVRAVREAAETLERAVRESATPANGNAAR